MSRSSCRRATSTDQSRITGPQSIDLADTVANVAAIVATVVVIAVASFFTAGTGGAAIIAALASAKVAAAAAIAAAAATIASKQLLKGSAYSGQEMGVDAIVGVVDADRLLRRRRGSAAAC